MVLINHHFGLSLFLLSLHSHVYLDIDDTM